MDKVYLRSLFLMHKGFLKKLYKSEEPPKRLLLVGNDNSLNVLIRILHLIAIGEISLRSSDSSILKKSLRLKKLTKFESKVYFWKLLNASREDKIKTLNQFSSVFPVLLNSFFNEA
jgi:hypothetical protein